MPNRIRELRLAAGLSAEQLAHRAGTTSQQIGRLEQGKRKLTVDWMNRLASAMNVMPSDLLRLNPLQKITSDVTEAGGAQALAIAAALAKRGLKLYEVTGDSVAESKPPGSLITVDETPEGIAGAQSGQIVVVEIGSERKKVLRVFVAPRLLVTNRRGLNTTVAVDDPSAEARIAGVVID